MQDESSHKYLCHFCYHINSDDVNTSVRVLYNSLPTTTHYSLVWLFMSDDIQYLTTASIYAKYSSVLQVPELKFWHHTFCVKNRPYVALILSIHKCL